MYNALRPLLGLILLVVAGSAGTVGAQTLNDNVLFHFGEKATAEAIAAWDDSIGPEGQNLPDGSGGYAQGAFLYGNKCLFCHGRDLRAQRTLLPSNEPIPTGGAPALIGGRGSLADTDPDKVKQTVESYWPYATTLFDYIRRAMPFYEPGSLTNDQVYALTAYILAEAQIIEKDEVMDAKSLPLVEMPNRFGFYVAADPFDDNPTDPGGQQGN